MATSLSTTPLISSSTHIAQSANSAVYLTRFWILGLFVIFCVMQNAMWNFYSPITTSLQSVYSWSDNFIEWLGNTANITFCVLVVPVAACVDLFGMRLSILVTIAALNVNAGLRLLPLSLVHASGYEAASMLSMVANGVAGTVESLAPPVLSFLWFPVGERATATAVMASSNTLGTAVGFLTALAVPASDSDSAVLKSLTQVYWSYFSICAVTLICVILYFPNQPPTPPSSSHSVPTVAVARGVWQLLRHGRFWVVVSAQAVPLGVLSAWLNVLGINLINANLSQDIVGWVGFSLAVGGTLGGIVSGRVCDLLPGRMTRVLACLYCAATVLVALFIMVLKGIIPYSNGLLIALSAAIGAMMYGAYPIFFELAIETTFPISGSATAGFLVMAQSVVQSIFLAIPVDQVGTAWMNYTLLICPAVFAGVLLFFREEHSRLDIDLHLVKPDDLVQELQEGDMEHNKFLAINSEAN
jgi:FLVCR family MFS transporter